MVIFLSHVKKGIANWQRDSQSAGVYEAGVRHLWLSVCFGVVDAARQLSRRASRLGKGGGGSSKVAGRVWPSLDQRHWRRSLLRPQDRRQNPGYDTAKKKKGFDFFFCRTRLDALISAPRCSSTFSFPSVSSWNTPERRRTQWKSPSSFTEQFMVSTKREIPCGCLRDDKTFYYFASQLRKQISA
jgi:hypothetical protein